MSEHTGMQWRLKKSCLSQGLVEMRCGLLSWERFQLSLDDVEQLTRGADILGGRPEDFILEHTALKEDIFSLGMNRQAHASNTNLWQGTQGPLPPGIISAWKPRAGTRCLWIPPLSYIFESSDFDCYLKLDTVVFFPHSQWVIWLWSCILSWSSSESHVTFIHFSF